MGESTNEPARPLRQGWVRVTTHTQRVKEKRAESHQRRMEKPRHSGTQGTNEQTNGWRTVERKKKPKKPTAKKIKPIISGVDNGQRTMQDLKAELNKDTITKQVVAKYFKWEYNNRRLLQQRGHKCGGVCLTVFSKDSADLLIRNGIKAYGQPHQIKLFTRALASDKCEQCHATGHLERTCRQEARPVRQTPRQPRHTSRRINGQQARTSPHTSGSENSTSQLPKVGRCHDDIYGNRGGNGRGSGNPGTGC
jgi:hypothetical protein